MGYRSILKGYPLSFMGYIGGFMGDKTIYSWKTAGYGLYPHFYGLSQLRIDPIVFKITDRSDFEHFLVSEKWNPNGVPGILLFMLILGYCNNTDDC
ncbi:hypothetical protein [Psychrobacillus sp. OK028]|uniref:hypothetical protein n=1 Tax=Psychrobacillus sp. OK028 TaxID=1884359 RepID=UPI0011139C4F|nr:hypothetical protein [Psychrobacillus sp. OK028]